MCSRINKSIADVAKLVDALDLGPSNLCYESSSLSIRNLHTQTRESFEIFNV